MRWQNRSLICWHPELFSPRSFLSLAVADVLPSALATGEGCHLLHAYGVNKRVGMAMCQPPLGFLAPKDQGYTKKKYKKKI